MSRHVTVTRSHVNDTPLLPTSPPPLPPRPPLCLSLTVLLPLSYISDDAHRKLSLLSLSTPTRRLSLRARGEPRATLLPLPFLLFFPSEALPLLVGSVLSTLLHHPSSSRANSRQPPLETTFLRLKLSSVDCRHPLSSLPFASSRSLSLVLVFLHRVRRPELFFNPSFRGFQRRPLEVVTTFEQRKSYCLDGLETRVREKLRRRVSRRTQLAFMEFNWRGPRDEYLVNHAGSARRAMKWYARCRSDRDEDTQLRFDAGIVRMTIILFSDFRVKWNNTELTALSCFNSWSYINDLKY